MKILELFCGLGGWSKGFHDIFPNAEFYGVDIKDYGYPYNFIKADLNDWEPKEKYDIPIPPVQVRFDECIGCQVCARVCTKLTWDAIRMLPIDVFEERYQMKIS